MVHLHYEYRNLHIIEPQYWKKKRSKKIFHRIAQIGGVIGGFFTGGTTLGITAASLSAEAQESAIKKQQKAEEELLRQQEETQKRLQKEAQIRGEVEQVLAGSLSSSLVSPEAKQELTKRVFFTMTEQEAQKIKEIVAGETKVIADRQSTAIQDLGNFVKELSKSVLDTYSQVQGLRETTQDIKTQSRPAEFKRIEDRQIDIKRFIPFVVIGLIILFFISGRRK